MLNFELYELKTLHFPGFWPKIAPQEAKNGLFLAKMGVDKRKIFDGGAGPNFSHIKIDPKTLLWCIFRQFKEGVFEKNALLCSPISAQKRPFLLS